MPLNGKIKVLYVIDDLGLGGAQRQLAELVKTMPKDEFDVQIVSLSTQKNDYVEALTEHGIEVTQVPESGKWSWGTFMRVYKKIKQAKPDLVHTWLFTASAYGRIAARLAGVPVIVQAIRSVDLDKPRHYVFVDWILKHITTAFTVNAKVISAVYAQREGIAASKMHTVYNGLDLNFFDPALSNGAVKKELCLKGDATLIGMVARLAPVKDHPTFIQAAALALKKMRDLHFAIIGNGPLEDELKTLAEHLGIASRIHFIDSRKDIAEVFSSLDVAVISSIYEGCSNVILEAMAMAKPVIATDVGGNPELVHQGENGMLVPVGDPAAMSEAMLFLAKHRDEARRMGSRGRARILEEFGIERMMTQTTSLYEKWLRGNLKW